MDQRSRSEKLVQRLRDFRSSIPDVEASAVVSADGLIIASDLPAGVEEDRVSAMSAAMLSLGDRIANNYYPYATARPGPYEPMPTAPPIGILHTDIRTLFRQCFEVAG